MSETILENLKVKIFIDYPQATRPRLYMSVYTTCSNRVLKLWALSGRLYVIAIIIFFFDKKKTGDSSTIFKKVV